MNLLKFLLILLLKFANKETQKVYIKKLRDGAIKNFTGISSPYEAPEEPQIHIKTDEHSIEECVDIVINYLIKFGYVKDITIMLFNIKVNTLLILKNI